MQKGWIGRMNDLELNLEIRCAKKEDILHINVYRRNLTTAISELGVKNGL